MRHIYAEHFAHCFAETFVFEVIKHSAERRVVSHNELTRHTSNQILLDIEPFIYAGEVVRFVVFEPVVFPKRVFYAERCGTCDCQRFE